jgi:hypothetical protein
MGTPVNDSNSGFPWGSAAIHFFAASLMGPRRYAVGMGIQVIWWVVTGSLMLAYVAEYIDPVYDAWLTCTANLGPYATDAAQTAACGSSPSDIAPLWMQAIVALGGIPIAVLVDDWVRGVWGLQ